MGTPPTTVPKYWGWRFHYALDTLMRAYQSARSAAEAEQQLIEKRYDKFRADREAGIPPGEDEDDWNEEMRHHDDQLAEEWQEAEDCLRLVTESFIIALFHLWERQLKRAMREVEYSHDKAVGWLKRVGLAPEAKPLQELKFCAETLKHSEGSSAAKLFELRNDLFDKALANSADEADYESIKVNNKTFTEFFDAVRASGPTDRSIGFGSSADTAQVF